MQSWLGNPGQGHTQDPFHRHRESRQEANAPRPFPDSDRHMASPHVVNHSTAHPIEKDREKGEAVVKRRKAAGESSFRLRTAVRRLHRVPGGRRKGPGGMKGRSDQEDQEVWSPGIQHAELRHTKCRAGGGRGHTYSGEARVRCSTQMGRQKRGVHHLVRFTVYHVVFLLWVGFWSLIHVRMICVARAAISGRIMN